MSCQRKFGREGRVFLFSILASRAIVGLLHSACWWPCPQSPVMQSKLCGCEEFLRHSSVELAPKNEKKPYGYHANLRS